MSDLGQLARAVEHPSPGRRKVAAWELLVGLLLAPASFSLQVVGSYVVSSRQCASGSDPRTFVVVLNLLAVVGAVVGMACAYDAFRKTCREKKGGTPHAVETGEGRTRFVAACALAESTIFLLAVVLGLTAVLTLWHCLSGS